ncbi:uncharacterized protein V1516DRAFT_678925, partial [Lipomyces oligophaga]|uniref:uncharacterized protein n=1 Tax=Lipomyces oligophaga TaxID=45792 RepID=UPI0034CD9C90
MKCDGTALLMLLLLLLLWSSVAKQTQLARGLAGELARYYGTNYADTAPVAVDSEHLRVAFDGSLWPSVRNSAELKDMYLTFVVMAVEVYWMVLFVWLRRLREYPGECAMTQHSD